jgi:hypothetical protein
METNWPEIEKVLLELIEHQNKELLKLGRRIVPTLTPEDMLQPNDYRVLENHPAFRYEEGFLSGLQTVQMALRAIKNEIG